MTTNDLKSMEYINRINLELERIRRLLNQTPEHLIAMRTKEIKSADT